MRRKISTFLLFLIGGTIFLTLGFYNNNWKVVEPKHYERWEMTYERVVVARLAKSRQDGIFSAGGLLGLADIDGWDFDPNHQYDVYESGISFEHYSPYRSNPGVQGIVFSIFDLITDFTAEQNIRFLRFSTVLLSALVLALFSAFLAVEFGWLAAILVLLFSVLSEWMILPAGNAYWNLWAFFLPFVTCIFILSKAEKKSVYPKVRVYTSIFIVTLVKILFNGFELITTTLVMATVPFVYYAVKGKWGWKLFFQRVLYSGIVMLLAVGVGLFILSIQIAAVDGSFSSSVDYFSDTLDKRASGGSEKYTRDILAESINVSIFVVIKKYLGTNAFNTQTQPFFWQIPYWQLIVLYIVFSFIWLVQRQFRIPSEGPEKGPALLAATWYSATAFLSWLFLFKPTSYIHTFLFPMGWQMPFVLLGLAFCGFVIQNFFRMKTA